jgi:hypothetical protein
MTFIIKHDLNSSGFNRLKIRPDGLSITILYVSFPDPLILQNIGLSQGHLSLPWTSPFAGASLFYKL